jgi:hypothetical protein
MKAKVPFMMSKNQRCRMNEEIEKELDAKLQSDVTQIDAAILWTLHLCFGFGKKRLRRFYDFFVKLSRVNDRWKIRADNIELLKGIGVDIEEWNREGSKH